MINTIIHGDCLEVMQTIPDNSVDLTITSPPYDNLRTYNGFSFDFEGIAKELLRVTKVGGVLVWVVADATIKGSETGSSFRQALFLKQIGFNLHDTMIYAKDNYTPLTHNRYEQQFEYMFVLSKGKPRVFNPLMIPTKEPGKQKIRTSKYDHARRGRRDVAITPAMKRKANIWSYPVGMHLSTNDRIAFEHPAIFPEQLAEDHILSWSNPGDIVFDPMCGSGTVPKMAMVNGRKYIGIETSSEYVRIANQRVDATLSAMAKSGEELLLLDI